MVRDGARKETKKEGRIVWEDGMKIMTDGDGGSGEAVVVGGGGMKGEGGGEREKERVRVEESRNRPCSTRSFTSFPSSSSSMRMFH